MSISTDGCGQDAVVGAAAAQIARHPLPDLLIGAAVAFGQQRDRGHDLPGGAVSALETVRGHERSLHRMQPGTRAGEPLDGRYFPALALHRQRQARQHAPTVDVDSARAARTLVAPLLRTGQRQPFPQHVQQAHPRPDRQLVRHAIDHDLDGVVKARLQGLVAAVYARHWLA
jgi:hypothetical protein